MSAPHTPGAWSVWVEANFGPIEEDRDEPFDEPECERCHGDGMDPWCDYLLPCPLCQGEQRP